MSTTICGEKLCRNIYNLTNQNNYYIIIYQILSTAIRIYWLLYHASNRLSKWASIIPLKLYLILCFPHHFFLSKLISLSSIYFSTREKCKLKRLVCFVFFLLLINVCCSNHNLTCRYAFETRFQNWFPKYCPPIILDTSSYNPII